MKYRRKFHIIYFKNENKQWEVYTICKNIPTAKRLILKLALDK